MAPSSRRSFRTRGSRSRAARRSCLAGEGRGVRVVSLPCLEEFFARDAEYRASVLPDEAPRLVVEAGVELGIARILRPGDRFHGMDGFGSSAPYGDLARHFGFTAEELCRIAREMLAGA